MGNKCFEGLQGLDLASNCCSEYIDLVFMTEAHCVAEVEAQESSRSSPMVGNGDERSVQNKANNMIKYMNVFEVDGFVFVGYRVIFRIMTSPWYYKVTEGKEVLIKRILINVNFVDLNILPFKRLMTEPMKEMFLAEFTYVVKVINCAYKAVFMQPILLLKIVSASQEENERRRKVQFEASKPLRRKLIQRIFAVVSKKTLNLGKLLFVKGLLPLRPEVLRSNSSTVPTACSKARPGARRLVIIDYDDTILPTFELQYYFEQKRIYYPETSYRRFIPYEITFIDKQVVSLLTTITEKLRCECIIVTSATVNWVYETMQELLPQTYARVKNKIMVRSAREMSPIIPNRLYWKTAMFSFLVWQRTIVGSPDSLSHLIVIGDGIEEEVAANEIRANLSKIRFEVTFFKFMSCPLAKYLDDELNFMNQNIVNKCLVPLFYSRDEYIGEEERVFETQIDVYNWLIGPKLDGLQRQMNSKCSNYDNDE